MSQSSQASDTAFDKVDRADQPADRSAEAVAPSPAAASAATIKPQPSYVKLAMRNMVRKGGKSLYHFGLTVIGLLAVLVGLAYLTR